jgi:hypothetical protein
MVMDWKTWLGLKPSAVEPPPGTISESASVPDEVFDDFNVIPLLRARAQKATAGEKFSVWDEGERAFVTRVLTQHEVDVIVERAKRAGAWP